MVVNLNKWFNHLTTPKQELNNKPICPFARAAISSKQITIQETNLDSIENQVSNADIATYKVCIYYLPTYKNYDIETLEIKTKRLNEIFIPDNKVVLDNDPRNPFTINGVTTTFPDWYLWIVQDLADLTSKSNSLKLTDYYSYWTKQQLDEVVTWRNHTKI
tara:strand:- start:92 stop:574 length:483 start_codon:yes stop_codon:yes gene_type:complete